METMSQRIERMNREGAEAAALEKETAKITTEEKELENPLPLAKKLVKRLRDIHEEKGMPGIEEIHGARQEMDEIVIPVEYHGLQFVLTTNGHNFAAYYKERPIYGYPMSEVLRCPLCGATMVKKTGQYGSFWGCGNWPMCTGALSDPVKDWQRERHIDQYGYFPDLSEV